MAANEVRATAHSVDCPATRRPTPRISLYGVDVDPLSMDDTVAAALAMVRCGRAHQHVCLNAAKIVELDRNPALVQAVNACDLVSVDGQAVVWAARLLERPVPERVAGVDLFERLLSEAEHLGLRVFLLGATPDTVRLLMDVVAARWPGLVVAGTHDGYWAPDAEAAVVRGIADSRADLLFVALPSPRKELFLERHGDVLGVPFRMGVGGSFDVLAGVTKRAPRYLQKLGLEWLFRFSQEPRRMFKRYLFGNTAFVVLTLRERRRLRRDRHGRPEGHRAT